MSRTWARSCVRLRDSTLQETTVQRELDLVGLYLRIQQRRFSDRLRVNYRIAPQVLPAALPSWSCSHWRERRDPRHRAARPGRHN